MAEQRIISIDITHLVTAALAEEPDTARTPLPPDEVARFAASSES